MEGKVELSLNDYNRLKSLDIPGNKIAELVKEEIEKVTDKVVSVILGHSYHSQLEVYVEIFPKNTKLNN